MQAVFDTNILIDYLSGNEAARDELSRYDRPLISPITWMEVMVGARPPEASAVRAFLERFRQIPIDGNIAERAVTLRREHSLRLPDAIIWASALTRDALLVSRDTRVFPEKHPGIRNPYPA